MTKDLTVLAPFTVQLMVVAPPESLRPVSGSSFSLLVVLFPFFLLVSFGSIHAQHVAHHMWSNNVDLSLTERLQKNSRCLLLNSRFWLEGYASHGQKRYGASLSRILWKQASLSFNVGITRLKTGTRLQGTRGGPLFDGHLTKELALLIAAQAE